ncbi:hypothetical protein TRVL_05971 [Trypanosoma vivax]|uniref:Uncharacterized protein n=1 Tax=Trypanosoma vivax (strain Y486) TaxID=1055687 RepID=G0UBQ8_TRYVY|nr:hypothetical protein TRVL_05971 [Trypanosoma vivax]CCC53256.1 conserved hypothetical protein [Trypanosoma vivax Y486]
MTMPASGASLPEGLRRIMLLSSNLCNGEATADVEKQTDDGEEGGAPLSVAQLLAIVQALRKQFAQLVATVAADCADGTALKSTEEQLEILSQHVKALQKGIRGKNVQCARIALCEYLAREVEMRRRAVGRMRAAINIAKGSI